MIRLLVSLGAAALCACTGGLDARARDYLALALAWEAHDPGFVDAYYGPEIESAALDAAAIYERTVALERALTDVPGPRARRLRRLVRSLAGRIDVVEGRVHRFDDEARAVIGIVPPRLRTEPEPAARDRTQAKTERLEVSPDVIRTVLEAALAECRARTIEHVDLPPDETVTLELVHAKPWAAYHDYEGDYRSTVRFNLDYPLYIDRAIDEICHEAYPGHHVQQVLMERYLVEERGFIEYSLLPAFGPVPFLAEGAANEATRRLFPGDERLRFEHDVLYPLAGLDPEKAEAQAAAREMRRSGDPLVLEAARRNLDGEIDLYNAVLWLEARGVSDARAVLEYAWLVRSHLAAYTWAETLVRRHVERDGVPWMAWTELWTTPLFPEDL